VKYYTNKARQAGMTLIELTVVLLVLVGLAGLLIPYVSGFVTKTHDSTGASNIQSLNNAMQRYAVEHYDNYPNKMDSLLISTGDVYPKMMGEMMGMSYFTPFELDSAKANALKSAGVKKVMEMDDTTGDATFANTTGVVTDIASGVKVVEVTGAPLSDLSHRLGKPTDTGLYHYFAFGIGDDSSIAGATVSDVPVHFSRNGDMGANNAYNHFVAIFEVLRGGACDTAGYTTTLDPGALAIAAADTVTFAAASAGFTAIPVAATYTTEALCLANNGLSEDAAETVVNDVSTTAGANSADDTYISSGVVWLNPNTDVAKFVGSAMAMGMGNLEGLGASMTRYYENSATN